MADDDSRFGLDKLRDGVSRRKEELSHSEDPRVRSFDDNDIGDDEGPFKPFTFQSEDFDRTEPDKDELHQYWRQFETVPFVRKSITSFARQVMEPGYYIQARGIDQEQLQDLDHWLTRSAIIEGNKGQDFRQLAKKAIVQMEVRGTAFVEKAPDRDNPDQIAGLKLINAETMEAVTRPGQSILLDPEDIDEFDDAPEAESGGAAAWLQDLGETESVFGRPVDGAERGLGEHDETDASGDFKIGFQRDEIIAMRRDADVGELFGTSRLEAVSDRIKGLRQKLSDNDDAIASKAYPLWLFLFGSEDNPWEADDINEFMKSHEMENFHSGMKQGVRGDVSVKTVSGEVAEIAESLNFDIQWIMSIMPIPTFALGAFSENTISQFGGIAQQQETQRQIKDTRRDLEDEFTPVIRKVAQQFGVPEDAAETIRLKIGSPGEPEPEVPQRENVIRYIPKNQRDPGSPNPETESPGNDGIPTEEPTIDDVPKIDSGDEEEPSEEAGAQVWHTDEGVAHLSLQRDSELSDTIYETLLQAREDVLDRVAEKFEGTPSFAAANFENTANSVLRQQMSRHNFRDEVRPVVEELVDDETGSFRRSNDVRFFLQDIENSTEDALEEMLRLMRIQVRRGANNGEEMDDIASRIRNKYNDAQLRERAELISHMELKNVEETTKLQRFEDDPDVVGVRVVNEDPSTPLTESLSGVEAFFEDGPIHEQLMNHTRSQFLHKGFDPLPPTPPYHYNDTTTLEPILESDER